MKLTFTFLFLLAGVAALACPMESAIQIASSPDPFIEDADIVFLGRLDRLANESDRIQIASFSVLKLAKGPKVDSVVVVNKFVTSCSRPFQNIGGLFWMLAVTDEETGNYMINARGGFVPRTIAEEYHFDPSGDL